MTKITKINFIDLSKIILKTYCKDIKMKLTEITNNQWRVDYDGTSDSDYAAHDLHDAIAYLDGRYLYIKKFPVSNGDLSSVISRLGLKKNEKMSSNGRDANSGQIWSVLEDGGRRIGVLYCQYHGDGTDEIFIAAGLTDTLQKIIHIFTEAGIIQGAPASSGSKKDKKQVPPVSPDANDRYSKDSIAHKTYHKAKY